MGYSDSFLIALKFMSKRKDETKVKHVFRNYRQITGYLHKFFSFNSFFWSLH